MANRVTQVLISSIALLLAPVAVHAQEARPPAAVEVLAGYAGFVDDATIDHAIVGAAARVYLTPRVAVGPELVYMRGPGSDRDLFLTGNMTFDILPPLGNRQRRVTPFLVAGGGFMQHRDRFGSSDFASYEGAVTGGGGVRAWVHDRVYVLGDVRLGWELHTRVNAGVGIRLGP